MDQKLSSVNINGDIHHFIDKAGDEIEDVTQD
jgi:hypothetical protein